MGALSLFRPLGQTWQRNDRKSQKGTNLPFWHVCLTVCPTSQYWGHFLLTSPPLVTAGWAARNILCLGFLLFCFGLVSNTGILHRCNLTYSHNERKTNMPKHPQRHQKTSRKCERCNEIVLKCNAGSECGGACTMSKGAGKFATDSQLWSVKVKVTEGDLERSLIWWN